MVLREYIEKYGDFSFLESPFNDVDNLLLTELSYIDFRGVMPAESKAQISLEALGDSFFSKYTAKEIKKLTTAPSIQKIITLFQMMSKCRRYRGILLFDYVNHVEYNTQFGAVCMLLEDGTLYISFEGTDDSIFGWKEDFFMAYQFPVLAQEMAMQYLHQHVSMFGPKVRIGGHSKGGNLAMSSYMLCHFWIRNKVICIYNNDGPGFRQHEIDSKAYQKMLKKLRMFIPEESVVGMLFCHPDCYSVVKSNQRGIWQHDGTSWLVDGTSFLTGKLSGRSKKMERRIFRWITQYTDSEREKIVVNLFSIFEKSGVKGLSELRITNINKIIALIKESKEMDKATRKFLLDSFKNLLLQKEQEKE